MKKSEYQYDDYQDQYDVLIAEEEEKQRKKTFWILFLCLIIILFSVLGATYSYIRIYNDIPKNELNIDTDGDGIPDLNLDIDGNGFCEVSCDTTGNRKPDLNVSYSKKHNSAIFNLDTDGDGKPDKNLMNQDTNHDEVCDLNCDIDDDGYPDFNIDIDGDGNPDINIDINGDKKPDINIDTDLDGKPDINIDTDGDGKCDKKCDINGDGICDTNCEISQCPANCHSKEDGICECNADPIIQITTGENESAILFVSYNKSVHATSIHPGWNDAQTFTVENQSNRTITFNLNWINITNEFTIDRTFTYSIKRDGFLQKESIPAPRSSSTMLSRIVIPANTTYYYEIEYSYNDLPDVDQNMEQGRTFGAQIAAEIVN